MDTNSTLQVPSYRSPARMMESMRTNTSRTHNKTPQNKFESGYDMTVEECNDSFFKESKDVMVDHLLSETVKRGAPLQLDRIDALRFRILSLAQNIGDQIKEFKLLISQNVATKKHPNRLLRNKLFSYDQCFNSDIVTLRANLNRDFEFWRANLESD